MLRSFGYFGMAASFVATLALAGAPNAFAQNKPTHDKLTYEQAWAACVKDVKSNYPNEYSATNQRYPRFMNCMFDYGYPRP
jgi:hypothetical protein